MKKMYPVVVALLLAVACRTAAQTPSATEKRFLFFKLWNFIKYYHPALAAGPVDADSLFFRHLPAAEQASNTNAFNAFVAAFLDGLPAPPPGGGGSDTARVIYRNLDLDWFRQGQLINRSNKDKLNRLFSNRYGQSSHRYIPALRYHTDIPNEPGYAAADTVNLPYALRMLALARIQGAADYLFPHKYLMDKNFDSVVRASIPLFAACTSRMVYEKLLLQVISCFDDTHSFKFVRQVKYRTAIFRNSFFPPFAYQVLENEIVVTDTILPLLCREAGLQPGDRITAINNRPVRAVIADVAVLLSASNRPTLLYHLSDYASNLLWRSDSSAFFLTVKRGGTTAIRKTRFAFNKDTASIRILSRYLTAKQPAPRSDNRIDILQDDIAYIKITETARFFENEPDSAVDRVMDSLLGVAGRQKGIIFDMRGYPDWGGFVHTYVYKKFGRAPNRYADYYEVNKATPGSYVINSGSDTYYDRDIVPANTPYPGKVVIIVNPATLSMSEWNTMNLQYLFPKSITIGESSAGADGDEKTMALPGGYEFYFTGNAIFYPDGTAAQRKGVRIDRRHPLTAADVANPADELLEQAIRIVREP
ncbi:MAG: S41 family peptidase [Chitinophagaceae bacterium]